MSSLSLLFLPPLLCEGGDRSPVRARKRREKKRGSRWGPHHPSSPARGRGVRSGRGDNDDGRRREKERARMRKRGGILVFSHKAKSVQKINGNFIVLE